MSSSLALNDLGAPYVLPEEQVEQWRARLRQEVVQRRAGGRRSDGRQGSDLAQMLSGGTVMALRGKERVEAGTGDLGKPRFEVEGQTLAWSEITGEWDRAHGRMMILGPAGNGKTQALVDNRLVPVFDGLDEVPASYSPSSGPGERAWAGSSSSLRGYSPQGTPPWSCSSRAVGPGPDRKPKSWWGGSPMVNPVDWVISS